MERFHWEQNLEKKEAILFQCYIINDSLLLRIWPGQDFSQLKKSSNSTFLYIHVCVFTCVLRRHYQLLRSVVSPGPLCEYDDVVLFTIFFLLNNTITTRMPTKHSLGEVHIKLHSSLGLLRNGNFSSEEPVS